MRNIVKIVKEFLNELIASTQDFPTKLAEAAKRQILKYVDGLEYVKAEITGSNGEITILDTTTVKAVGRSSFDKGQVPGQYFGSVLIGINVKYAQVASTVTTAFADLAGTLDFKVVRSEFENAIANSELILLQNSNELVRLSISNIINYGTPVDSNNLFYHLAQPIHINGEIPLYIKLSVPNVTLTTGKRHFVEIALQTCALKQK